MKETGSLQTMLEGLKTPTDELVVMDRCIASEENLAWLALCGSISLVVNRHQWRVFV